MAENILRAIITADGREFTKTMTQLESQFKRFQEGLKSASGVDSVARINRALDATKQRIDALKGFSGNLEQGFQRTAAASNQATFALVNTGRVLQDLPFGIIGVANNINPLVESFQRLRIEAKATGQTIGSTLLGALRSGGGLGIAVSLITSALTFAAIGFSSFSRGVKKAGTDADETAKKIKELIKPIEEIRAAATGGIEGEIAHVQALASVVLNQTKSYKERNNALSELQRINKNYFGDMTLEEAKLALLTGKVNEYTQALLQQAIIKEFSGELAKLSVELFKQRGAYISAALDADKYTKSLEGAKKATKDQAALLPVGVSPTVSTTTQSKEAEKANKKLEEQGIILHTLEGQYKKLQIGIRQAVEESLKFKPLQALDTPKLDTDSILKERQKIIEKFRELFKFVGKDFPEIQLQAELKLIPKTSFGNQILNDFLEDQLSDVHFEDLQAAKEMNKLITEGIKNVITKTPPPEPVDVNIPVNVKLTSDQERIAKDVQDLVTTITNTIIDSFAALGEGIGNIIAGGSFKDLFSGIFQVLGQGLKQLGTQLIVMSKLIASIKKALATALAGNPVASVAIGVALIALGTAMQKSLQFRERGGSVNAGQTYIVGEKGPEIFVPNKSGTIIPNSQIGGAAGGMKIEIFGRFEQSGNDMVAVISKVNRSQTRG